MNTFIAIVVFVIGITIGSFLSVVVYRMQKKAGGIVSGRSYCPNCKAKLKWHHLIPVLSWIMLRGRCADCGKRISSHYIVMELMTGLLFLGAFLNWNFLEPTISTVNAEIIGYVVNWGVLQEFLFYIVEFSFLIAIFFYDMIHKEIPDQLSIPAIIIAFVGGLMIGTPTWTAMLIGAAGVGGFFLAQFILSKGRWVGGGDIRLGILMGLLLGWKLGIVALAISYLLGGLLSVFLLTKGVVNRKTEIAFGPFLITGLFASIFFGQEIIAWYFDNLLF